MMSTSAIMGEFQGWLSNAMRTEEGKQLLDDIGKAHSEHKKGSQALIGAREAAGEKRLAKDKTVTLDRILKIASVGLPLAGMLAGGRRPGKGAYALGALGKVAGGIDTLRTQRRGLQREREYSMTMGDIEAEQKLLDTGLESQTGLAQTRFDVGQQGFENMLAAENMRIRGLPKADKPPTTLEALIVRYLSAGQKVPNELMRLYLQKKQGKPTGLPTSLQRLNIGTKDIMSQATQAFQGIPQETRERAGIEGEYFTDEGGLATVANKLGSLQDTTTTGMWPFWQNTEITPTPDSTLHPYLEQLRTLRRQFLGGGSKPPDMTEAEWQDYLQMKGQ